MTIQRFSFHAMASPCEICIDDTDDQRSSMAASLAEAEVKRIEAKYSRFRSDSVISRINAQAASLEVDIDSETDSLLAYAGRLHALSDGLFDITTGVLHGAWDFKNGVLPCSDALQERLTLVGWQYVRHQHHCVRFMKSGVRIDLGGLGKEYAADRAADILAQAGICHGYVNLGGDLRAIGPKQDGASWMIGIQHPRKPKQVIATIPVATGGLATSGDYERYFEQSGRRYCHLLRPQDGWPVSGWQAVSVLAPQAITAGATATIAMLKEACALDFLKSTGFSYLAVNAEGEIFST